MAAEAIPAQSPRPVQAVHRLPAALARLSSIPALAESRQRLLRLLLREGTSKGELVRAIESDVALAVAVLRSANHMYGKPAVASIPDAVAVLSPQGVHVLAKRIAVVDFFEQPDTWQLPADHLRLHAVAVQAVADRVARELDYRERDRLAVVSLLHDVGKLVLAEAYGSHEASNGREPATPEARLDAERREFGIDHAVVGGVLLRRWGLPDALATSVERHHDPRDDMTASIVRVADMIAHYRQGRPVDRRQLIDAARRIRLDADAIRSLMYEGASIVAAPRAEEPSPLSAAQTRALRLLAEGKVYKEIAAELQISPSTVRSHLHATYSKLGVADRAQAVLRATEQGWL